MKIIKIGQKMVPFNSVRDPSKMFSVREIGKNAPVSPIRLTHWIEEAEKWLQELGEDKYEIVRVIITPYEKLAEE